MKIGGFMELVVILICFIVANLIVVSVRKIFMKIIGASMITYSVKNHFIYVILLTVILFGCLNKIFNFQ